MPSRACWRSAANFTLEGVSIMLLKDFVKGTLVEIAQGVAEAKKDVESAGARLNPPPYGVGVPVLQPKGPVSVVGGTDRYRSIMEIEFDVAVTAVESEGTEGKAGIRVFDFGIGGGMSLAASTSSVSRIKFSVPIVFPS
jgi:hypothetical protein